MDELGVTMALSSFFRRATSLLGLGSPTSTKPAPLDGEIIYCKNNVCVHPPAVLSAETEHHPGYLNIRSQDDEVLGSTLILTWIPNSTLKKNPRSIENSPANRKISPRRSPRQEYAKSDKTSPSSEGSPEYISSPEYNRSGSDCDKSGSEVTRNGSQGKVLVEGVPSQDDSGIMSGSSVKSDYNEQNNTRDITDLPKVPGVGQNVNVIHKDKEVNEQNFGVQVPPPRMRSAGGSMSSESDTPAEVQLNALIMSPKVKHPQTDNVKDSERKRTSSSLSVTSIEMEGDNLVVVTEEADDDAIFLEDEDINCNKNVDTTDRIDERVNGDVNNDGELINGPRVDQSQHLAKADVESNGLSSESTQSSHSLQDYEHVIPDEKTNVNKLKESLDLKLNLSLLNSPMPDISITDSSKRARSLSGSSGSSTTTSGPDSCPPSPITPPLYPAMSPHSADPYSLTSESEPTSSGHQYSSPESLPVYNNMTFPENSVNFDGVCSPGGTPASGQSARDQVCGVFSVDLGQMRSLRIFYSDEKCSSGQLVIASRESQYKILHFHHGGLGHLADTFADWKFLAQPEKPHSDLDLHCKHFSVIRPSLGSGQTHPEEGAYEVVNQETWNTHMNEFGQIEDDFHLRKAIFFAGLEPGLRQEMWPFLLHYYPYNSTFEEREQIRNDKYIEYQNIRKQRECLSKEEQEQFFRNVQCIVEKDVVRTDRSHPYFKGENNPNLEILKNILLNYAVAHPHYGYTQGMSDLLAPVLVEIQNEVDAYWCFVGLMQKTIFVSSPKDIDMDKQLIYLLALLELMLPDFYAHLCKVQDGKELLFCHRWILLCFKREFSEVDALRMWEACWAHYQTDYFHLFLCMAIIAVYGEDVVDQDLPADEMLLHFSSLSMHMNGEVILRKARGFLHQFRTLPKIPCTLDGLCTLCGPGMWDSGHVPTVECVGNHDDDLCPYGGKVLPSQSRD